MIGQNSVGANFTATETGASFKLGTHMKGDDGSEWVYVQASGAITGAGYVVTLDETFQAAMATNTTAAYGDIIAVPGVAFADDEYGWVQIKGPCSIRVAASCAANAALATTTTAGQIDDATGSGTKNISGIALTTANGGSAATAAGYLNYPVTTSTN